MLRGLGITGSLQGKPALLESQRNPMSVVDLQIEGKPHDNYRIFPQSVNITGFPRNMENLQRPRNAL